MYACGFTSPILAIINLVISIRHRQGADVLIFFLSIIGVLVNAVVLNEFAHG